MTAPKRKIEASDRVARAEKLIARWLAAAEKNTRAAMKAREKGNTERAERLEGLARKAMAHMTKAVVVLAKYRPIANMAGVAGRVVEKGEAIAATARKARGKAKGKGHSQRKSGGKKSLAESPYGNGFDRVERVVDTISAMRKRGQLTEPQYHAAERYREAHDATHGSIVGAMDPDRGGGGGGSAGGTSPSEEAMWGAQLLREARGWLGEKDADIVAQVAGQGRSIDDVAGGRSATRRDKDHIGRRLRDGLALLASKWFPKRRRASVYRAPDAAPRVIREGSIQRGRAAHADSEGVRFSDDKS